MNTRFTMLIQILKSPKAKKLIPFTEFAIKLKINAINRTMKDYAKKNGMVYLDYYSSMVGDKNGLREDYTYDGVHPNKTGYRVMSDLANNAISTIFGLNGIND